jgi:hypothetical protein
MTSQQARFRVSTKLEMDSAILLNSDRACQSSLLKTAFSTAYEGLTDWVWAMKDGSRLRFSAVEQTQITPKPLTY